MRHPLSLIALITSLGVSPSCRATPDAAERSTTMDRAQLILARGASRRFEPFDRFAQFQASQGRSLAELLDEFTAQRNASHATPWRAYLPVLDC